ncbi:hypothetical protein [Halalkalibacter akibai]|nr:hypothetical protein [Halalkalibacter akibai]
MTFTRLTQEQLQKILISSHAKGEELENINVIEFIEYIKNDILEILCGKE